MCTPLNSFATVIFVFRRLLRLSYNCSISGLIGIWAPLPFQMKIKNLSKRHLRVPSGEKGLKKVKFWCFFNQPIQRSTNNVHSEDVSKRNFIFYNHPLLIAPFYRMLTNLRIFIHLFDILKIWLHEFFLSFFGTKHKIGSFRLPTHTCGAHRKFFCRSLLKLK